jgi:hypothetical protein
MCIDTSISGCSSEVLLIFVGDMLASLCISVFLGQAKVDHEYLVGSFFSAHEEIVWFNIPVQIVH